MGLLLVVNVHGMINSPAPVRKALEELKVGRRFSASVVPDDPATLGALRLCKDRLVWAPLDAELLAALLEKRGMVSSTKALDKPFLKGIGYGGYQELAARMVKEELRLSEVEGLRPFFRLAPPKGGFRLSMRRASSEGGILGMNPRLGELVKRMM